MSRLPALALALLTLACTSAREDRPATSSITWIPWSDDVFERARREDKLVLLDLEAVWCHWCHVMDEVTYRDPAVVELVRAHCIAVRVDQDARPDLSNRYEDYGWPATIVFRADGVELAKRAGYLPPGTMSSMLAAFAADPTPGPSAGSTRVPVASGSSALSDDLRAELEAAHSSAYDRVNGGWGTVHKWLDPPSVEYALLKGLEGDAENEGMARTTLERAQALIDPVWGGVYQYSVGDWHQPHFEKIMSFQADDLRIYVLAYAALHEERDLAAAQAIHRYLREFLTERTGAFYTSQDADLVPGEHSAEYFALDDAARRARGIPRIDTHVYARENGWAIRALASLYAYAGDESALAEARRAAEWILAQRALSGGGFRHDERDLAGPFLGDTLAMAQAFLALYEATAERAWLARAEQASDFIAAHFALEGAAGYATAAAAQGAVLLPGPQRDENVGLARLENELLRYGGRAAHQERAERALRYLFTPEVARRPFAASSLLVDRELGTDPPHVVVVGAKEDARALALFRAALALPSTYRQIEWFDAAEGPLPNAEVEYPTLDRPAAFACAGGRCSSPAYEPADVQKRLEALLR